MQDVTILVSLPSFSCMYDISPFLDCL